MLANELLSRQAMRATPPHLLLTNYAMLEYLLLRPADMDLFEGEHAGCWQFLVLDEAHVYDGARAAEVAMLLRRLRDRVARDRPLRYIATSATVGDKAEDVTGVRAPPLRRAVRVGSRRPGAAGSCPREPQGTAEAAVLGPARPRRVRQDRERRRPGNGAPPPRSRRRNGHRRRRRRRRPRARVPHGPPP